MALSAAAVGGLNVPQAAGEETAPTTPTARPSTPTGASPQRARIEASALQHLLEQRDAQRATRAHLRVVAADLKARQKATRKAAAERAARAARERARPKFVAPVASYRISASFGASSGLWSNRHTGQDFAAPTGTAVRAAADGRIVSAGSDGAYGQKLVVLHADGTETWYCHLSSFVRTTGMVKAGELIGRVGTTGNTTGPHLHFEVRPAGGRPINPMGWLRAHGVRI
jgi:murein DD-endopeptidase MepM/ murein hydrolase activator NlpD